MSIDSGVNWILRAAYLKHRNGFILKLLTGRAMAERPLRRNQRSELSGFHGGGGSNEQGSHFTCGAATQW
ncbi:hypothetical protein EYF80_039585 [Liparis tanakae]|uniref:Uncharacterized protein n=1 Tax=Liparis tanakae TaxID=230148 RepID=A0A4Z2GBC5_9TELE|nr:hypothetical protein EYF80_039585 [Liparis tanakae]